MYVWKSNLDVFTGPLAVAVPGAPVVGSTIVSGVSSELTPSVESYVFAGSSITHLKLLML